MLRVSLPTILAALLIGPFQPPLTGQELLPPPGQAWVIFGADTVQAEVARTPEERERGLMYRESLAKGRGMLFVFPEAQFRSFWMKDTFIPLDIAYLDAELRIVDVLPMEPRSENTYPSTQPAMFALEVTRGWFAEKGIAVGAQARVVFGPGGGQADFSRPVRPAFGGSVGHRGTQPPAAALNAPSRAATSWASL